MKSPLERLVGEAKQHDRGPELSDATWRAMEERLVATALADSRERRSAPASLVSSTGRGRGRVMVGVATALALAASVVAVVHVRDRAPGPPDPQGSATVAITADPEAGSLRETQGAGVVRIRGAVATTGAALAAGDVIEAQGARAVLDRPQKVAWLLEGNAAAGAPSLARAHVKSAGDALVVGLDEGAIEAQVTPVSHGEAFAVDVASGPSLVRVAVHGTHLRVARDGSRVTVDVNEGVVSIGVPPASGLTTGTTVQAPSHVEFDATDLATLRVDHAPSAVRAPVALVPTIAERSARNASAAAAPDPAPPGKAPGHLDRLEDRGAAPTAPRVADSRGVTAAGAIATPHAPASTREAIAHAVRTCAASHGSSGAVRVSVQSSLELKVGGRGKVEAARFDPPLAPEIQSCAAVAIYQLKVDDAVNGSLRVPIEFSY